MQSPVYNQAKQNSKSLEGRPEERNKRKGGFQEATDPSIPHGDRTI
jgi:hypothetical protein